MLHAAREKTEVARWIPKMFRGLFRRQGAYNRLVLDTAKSLVRTNSQLSNRVRELSDALASQNRWLRELGGVSAMAQAKDVETLQLQMQRLREQSNWLGREVNHMRDALEASAAEMRSLAQTFETLDVVFIKATLLQHGTLLQSFIDAAQQREAELKRSIEEVSNLSGSSRVVLDQHATRLDAAEAERAISQARWDAAMQPLSQQLEEISAHFNAGPYVSNPAMLRMTNAEGAETIGYRETSGGGNADTSYISFENIFRGPEDLIRKRQAIYLEDLRGHEPVVDLGCGRGEMLDLLKKANITASGVDVDPGMVRRVLNKGHRVEQRDLLDYLAAQPDASIGAVFSAQVIEHLPFEGLLEFLRLTLRKLKPDGVLVAETVNPHSHRALKTFWVDLTHNKPIFPEVLVALCRQAGYKEAIVRFPCGTGGLERDRLWEGEYAVVARTPDG